MVLQTLLLAALLDGGTGTGTQRIDERLRPGLAQRVRSAPPLPMKLAQADAGASSGTSKKAPAKAARVKAAPATADASTRPIDPEVKKLVDRMQAFYEATADFTADFRQDYSYRTSRRKQTSTGKVSFKKPALMRWEYETPGKKTFVLAGEKVYAHDPQAKLLTVAQMGQDQLSAAVTFLWGRGKLEDEFAIAKVACRDCKGTRLELTPLRPEKRFKKIYLDVDEATAQVLRSTVVDPDGSENAITFSGMRTNVGLGADAFKLTPPKDTQVQDYTRAVPARP